MNYHASVKVRVEKKLPGIAPLSITVNYLHFKEADEKREVLPETNAGFNLTKLRSSPHYFRGHVGIRYVPSSAERFGVNLSPREILWEPFIARTIKRQERLLSAVGIDVTDESSVIKG